MRREAHWAVVAVLHRSIWPLTCHWHADGRCPKPDRKRSGFFCVSLQRSAAAFLLHSRINQGNAGRVFPRKSIARDNGLFCNLRAVLEINHTLCLNQRSGPSVELVCGPEMTSLWLVQDSPGCAALIWPKPAGAPYLSPVHGTDDVPEMCAQVIARRGRVGCIERCAAVLNCVAVTRYARRDKQGGMEGPPHCEN
jgi:hypothetical protein